MKKNKEKPSEKIWIDFKKDQNLTNDQCEQFKKYEEILSEWNEKINLTSIKDLAGIIRQHFMDSLILKKFLNLNEITTVVDIGAGAGFPSLPLKLIFPNLKVILLEVNKKKQKFLSILIKILNLKDVQICDLDWRTFLRTTTEDVDLFVTRAALNELELCRLFKPACHYKHSLIVYWASEQWEPHERAEKFVREFKPYRLGHKKRKLVFMSLNESER